MDIYKITYEADDDYKEGVPDQSADGWDFGDALAAKESGDKLTVEKDAIEKKNSKSNLLLIAGVAALAWFAFKK